MATRSHVDVSERRLRPIYDCLDNGNNKKALQEADKVLKKQKDFQCAKALKALALLRLGRHDDSLVLLMEVHGQCPTDEATLQAMSICYREIHDLKKIADMYENAHKSKPDSEEILSALFMAYVRLGDYKSQQRTAMVLHRLKPNKNPYYFWAVMSIVMQAHVADNKLAQGMFLPLAERMTMKYVNDGKIEAEAEVQMYLIILEQMQKFEEALKVVEGPLGEKLTSELNYQKTKAAELFKKLDRWPEMNATYRALLLENPDQWSYYKEYFKSLFSLVDIHWQPYDKDESGESGVSVEGIDYTVDRAIDFIKSQLQKNEEESRPLRGPYLAQLELIKQLQQRNQDCSQLGSPSELLRNYISKFGTKLACFGDLKNYFCTLDSTEQQKLLESLLEDIGLSTGDGEIKYAENRVQMQRHICLLQFSRFCGLHDRLDADGKIAFAKELIQRYNQGLSLGKELLSTDLQYSDDYLLLAVHTLYDVHKEQENTRLIWWMILLLEQGIRNSPSSYHFKLHLLYLYCSMGVFGPCPALYDSMEIKHIQNDTLGYVICNHVSRLGHFTAACSVYAAMLRFFTVNHKETTEYLISSYKYGSFFKIYEFVKFRERLQNSLQYAIATVERLLLDLTLETNSHNGTEQMISYMEIDPEKDKTDWPNLRDNRDFSVMTTWDPADRMLSEELKEVSFNEERSMLKLRNLTLRLLAASVMLGKQCGTKNNEQLNSTTNGDGCNLPDVFKSLQQQLGEHIDNCQEFLKPKMYPMHGPIRTRLSAYLQNGHGTLLLQMCDIVNYLHCVTERGIETAVDSREEELRTKVVTSLNELVARNKCSIVTEEDGKKNFHPQVLEDLVLITETFAHLTLLTGVCHKLLKPIKSALTKRNKKKKDNPTPMPPTFEHFNLLVGGLEKAALDFQMATLETDPVFLAMDMSCLKLMDSEDMFGVTATLEKDMWQKVEKSYQQSAKELTEFLQNKMHYLNSVKL